MNDYPAGIYLHIPFCRRKCHYCDFNSYAAGEAARAAYVEALLAEIRWWGRLLPPSPVGQPARARSLYVGGGTPSLLAPQQLERLLGACVEQLGVSADAEVTIEANPESASRDWLRSVRSVGYARLSLGVQSFDDRLLSGLGRLHSAADALRCYDAARRAGFDNVNLDLIFGLDGQSLSQWRHSLDSAVALSPEHLSLYGLTVEEGTPLSTMVTQGSYAPADAEVSAAMYVLAEEVLGRAGYEHYELSNWARPDRPSRHNLNYWEMGAYLGCGAGAHSHLGGARFWAVPGVEEYTAAWMQMGHGASGCAADKRIAEREVVSGKGRQGVRSDSRTCHPSSPYGWPEGAMAGWEVVTPELRARETIMLGLRLTRGLSPDAFQSQTGRALERVLGSGLAELREEGLLELTDGFLRATRQGRLLLDEVLARLFASMDDSASTCQT